MSLFTDLKEVLTPYASRIKNLDNRVIEVITDYTIEQGTVNLINGTEGSSLSTNRARTGFLSFSGDKLRIVPKEGYEIGGRTYSSNTISSFVSSIDFTTEPIEYSDPSKYYRIVIKKPNGANIPVESLPSDVITVTSYGNTDVTLTLDGKSADAGAVGRKIDALDNRAYKLTTSYMDDISTRGIWAQWGYTVEGNPNALENLRDYRIHSIIKLVRGEHYFLEWDNSLTPSFVGLDENFLNGSWLKLIGDEPLVEIGEETKMLDFDKVFDANPFVYYVGISVKNTDDSEINSDAYNRLSIYTNGKRYIDGYTLSCDDFMPGYYSSSNKNIVPSSNIYVMTPRIKVYKGDSIKVSVGSGERVSCILLDSDKESNLNVIHSTGSNPFNYIYVVPSDGYYMSNIKHTDGSNINYRQVTSTITICRKQEYKPEKDTMLLSQSGHTDSSGTLLTLVHFSDNHGVSESLDAVLDFYKKNYDKIDDIVNTGDSVYYYYGYSVDDSLISDFNQETEYSYGDYTVYGGLLYVCNSNGVIGSFDSSKWNVINARVSNYYSRNEYLSHEVASMALTVLGNHDTALFNYNSSSESASGTNKWYALPKEIARSVYFDPFLSKWNVVSPDGALYWYKDYTNAKIRMIGIDMAYWDSDEKAWLANTLSDARNANYSVILLSHYVLAPFTGNLETPFTNLTSPDSTGVYASSGTGQFGQYTVGDANEILIPYRDIIICNLCGHYHMDKFGFSALDNTAGKQLLTIQIDQCGAARAVNNSARVSGTDSKYLFNVITFDTTLKIIKIIRIGCDYDDYLRHKKTLCYNYDTETFIVKG